MTAKDFRRIALSLEGVEEYCHAGLPAFRVGGTKFASLASQAEGYGNLMLTLEDQAAFVEEAPEIFMPPFLEAGERWDTHMFGSRRRVKMCWRAQSGPPGDCASGRTQRRARKVALRRRVAHQQTRNAVRDDLCMSCSERVVSPIGQLVADPRAACPSLLSERE